MNLSINPSFAPLLSTQKLYDLKDTLAWYASLSSGKGLLNLSRALTLLPLYNWYLTCPLQMRSTPPLQSHAHETGGYGSRLFELLDRRVDATFKADLTRYVFEAVTKWEKRVKPIRIIELKTENYKLSFKIELANLEMGKLENVEVGIYA